MCFFSEARVNREFMIIIFGGGIYESQLSFEARGTLKGCWKVLPSPCLPQMRQKKVIFTLIGCFARGIKRGAKV
ncbi:MAG: hypothetical protein B6I38_01020 [Anaerolineaceae bacterium 4572_5.1]|nr:MAG: hypothetical protein B6I38_01020 [Anaerolineaceae bacterium 4572_5.1]